MTTKFLLLTWPLLVVGAAGQCSLCSNNDLSRPDNIIPTSRTCQELDTFLTASIPTTNTADTIAACDALRAQNNTNINLSGYCGCSGEEEETGTCNFCPLENVINADLKLDDDSIWTCGYLAELAPFVTNQILCDEFQKSIPLCCADFVPTCTLCGDEGSTMTRPDKVLPDTNTTCELADRYFGVIQNDDDVCQAKREADSSLVDLMSYCGCTGAEPPQTCSLCSQENLLDSAFVVRESDKMTCGNLVEMAPFVTSSELCEEYQAFVPLCCSNFEPTCTICNNNNNNSTMTKPDRIIPGTDETCELANRYFGIIQNDTGSCEAYRTEVNTNIHHASYCGCSGEEPPATCSFCSVDSLIDPDFVVSDEDDETITCGYLAEAAPHITSAELCEDFQYFIPLCCADFQPTCTICSSVAEDGASLTKPNDVIPGMEETCGVADRYFGLIQENATACNAKRVESSPDIDIAAYCGCPAEDPPNICNFCSAEDLIDPEIMIGTDDDARTCGYLASVAPYIANETLCSWLEYAEARCCNMKVKEPCSICNGAQMGQPDRIVEYKAGTTCRQLDTKLRRLPEGICDQVTGDWEIDLDSYCGCEGAMVLDRCQLCGEGQDLKNHLSALPDRPIWNCRVGHENAKFIASDQVCTSEIRTAANVQLCCEPIPPTTSPMPTGPWTGPPTVSPTIEGSDSHALSCVASMSMSILMVTMTLLLEI
jgi:hypothetical protein